MLWRNRSIAKSNRTHRTWRKKPDNKADGQTFQQMPLSLRPGNRVSTDRAASSRIPNRLLPKMKAHRRASSRSRRKQAKDSNHRIPDGKAKPVNNSRNSSRPSGEEGSRASKVNKQVKDSNRDSNLIRNNRDSKVSVVNKGKEDNKVSRANRRNKPEAGSRGHKDRVNKGNDLDKASNRTN